MENKASISNSNLNIAIIHPDLRIGGAERLIVDAVVQLSSSGHSVHVFTSHHDKNRCFEEVVSRMADLILVNSKFTAATFAKTFKHLHCHGTRPAVLYPAVNLDQFSNLMQQRNVLDGSNLADTSLTIAGGFDKRLKENVEYLEEVKSLAVRNGVTNRIRFITSCPTSERDLLLSECLCVLYTPQDEDLGIVPLEAMAAHKPVIACNSDDPVETVKDGKTSFLSDPNPHFSLAMAKFVQDPQLAEKMVTDARQHVEKLFSTEIFGRHLNRYVVDIARGKIE